MPRIEGELWTTTETPEQCVELASFSCGDKRHGHEATVERIVGYYRDGEIPAATLRVTREAPSGGLVGLSILTFRAGPIIRHRLISEAEYENATYVHVLALSANYRGGFTYKSDDTLLSDFLITETLGYINEHEDGMPIVQALIEPGNERSREMCFRNGFEQPFVTSPDLLYVLHPDAEV
ncbi:MAG TPA: hypothetical protein VGI24_10420, partial [Solirubrobacteraceae bacterium]